MYVSFRVCSPASLHSKLRRVSLLWKTSCLDFVLKESPPSTLKDDIPVPLTYGLSLLKRVTFKEHSVTSMQTYNLFSF